ncbi:hypothetical protein [Rubrolithibacter danxiaensis]|uniref:hypothetical protein n=1 Tax=Rubrolithibacter danxiaensis TaxID=3390805 RepID=UPI003BF7E675
MKNTRIHKIKRIIETVLTTKMRAAFVMYCRLVAIHFHFGYSFQTSSKDFIK